jgi:hypothetical protein
LLEFLDFGFVMTKLLGTQLRDFTPTIPSMCRTFILGRPLDGDPANLTDV